ncbi:hypothetical protein QTP86_004287 [Hemibagrus guttatus]|nr:hypothetical protein QTP86_004287 [Hemibagrus guttatus]
MSLLPPSSLQHSEGTASLICLLSAYSPQRALLGWTVDGAEVNEGVLTSTEEHNNGVYSHSSTLTLSKEYWKEADVPRRLYCLLPRHHSGRLVPKEPL